MEINREIVINTNLKETTDSLIYLYQDIERLFKQHNLKDDEIFNQSPDDIKEFINKNIYLQMIFHGILSSVLLNINNPDIIWLLL